MTTFYTSAGLLQGWVYNGLSFKERVVDMKRSRTEVGRWRMLRQVNRRKARWTQQE